MSLQLRKGRDGKLRPWWYGHFLRDDGSRSVVNLNVGIEGRPPASGKITDFGDRAFESSRTRALVELEMLASEAKKGRMTKEAALRQYRQQTGVPLENAPISALLSAREGDVQQRSEASVRGDQAAVKHFVAWASARGVSTVLDVSLAVAREYLGELYNPEEPRYTARTVRRIKGTLAIALGRTLPEGADNPFRHETLRIRAMDGDREFHREPLTPEQVDKLLATAEEEDKEAYDWIVAALSTGLRKGDVCRLRWANVDMGAGALRLQTSKTRADLHLPIMPKFAGVLARRDKARGRDSDHVFPEAAALMEGNEDTITKRVKKIFAHALAPPVDCNGAEGGRIDLAVSYKRVVKALEAIPMTPAKRERMGTVLRLYADGMAYNDIVAETGLSKGCVSGLIAGAERASGLRFIRRNEGDEKKMVAEMTRVKRTVGMKAASIYDFHALRTTFVTLAISAGVSVDKLRALTGHATVDLVMRHYFRPRGTDFADDLIRALPKSLTSTAQKRQNLKKHQ